MTEIFIYMCYQQSYLVQTILFSKFICLIIQVQFNKRVMKTILLNYSHQYQIQYAMTVISIILSLLNSCFMRTMKNILTILSITNFPQFQIQKQMSSILYFFLQIMAKINLRHILNVQFYKLILCQMALKRTYNLSQMSFNNNGVQNQNESKMMLPNYSQGILMIKQNYSKVYQYGGKLIPPLIKSLNVTYKDRAGRPGIVIQISALKVSIIVGDNRDRVSKTIEDKSKRLLPLNLEDIWQLVQRKIWIQIDKKLNRIAVNSGDVNKSKRQCILETNLIPSQLPRDWASQAEKYQKKEFQTSKMFQSDNANLLFLQSVSFSIEKDQKEHKNLIQKGQNPKIGELNDFYKIQILKNKRKNGPVLEKNPTLLKVSVANLETMEKQLQILYSWLEGLCLRKLPQYEVTSTNKGDYFDYLQWNNVRFAIHSSLVTPFTYINKKPVGILNHLFYVKYGRPYTAFQPQKKDSNQIMKQIYQKRQGYLRFQAIPPEGFAPGSNAVLQVWPPHNCSSIHNHGEAFGIIKVLGGDICVQNFEDLNFTTTSEPYMRNHYREGNYTWLSEHSYSIHRLVNLHPQTCITLQSYMNAERSKQFFSVINKSGGKQTLIKYYPQHDWLNYLKKIKLNYNNEGDRFSMQFIDSVIGAYGLKKNGELDTSFTTFCMLLKEEYNTLYNFIEKK